MPTYKVNKGFITQKMGDKTVIFDGDNSVLYTFNDTASYLFGKIKSGWETDRIIQSLMKTYSIDLKQAKKDVAEFIADLKKKKIIGASKPKK